MEHPFEWLRREFAPLFGRAFPAWPFEAPIETLERTWGLRMEEREKEFVVRAEVPGFEPNELEVLVEANLLTIRAVRPEPVEEAAKEAAVERPYGRLERTITLPVGVNLEAVEARYHNGVLEVHLPKTPEATARRIEVRT